MCINDWYACYTEILVCEADNLCCQTSSYVVINTLFWIRCVGCIRNKCANGKLLQSIFNIIFNLHSSHQSQQISYHMHYAITTATIWCKHSIKMPACKQLTMYCRCMKTMLAQHSQRHQFGEKILSTRNMKFSYFSLQFQPLEFTFITYNTTLSFLKYRTT